MTNTHDIGDSAEVLDATIHKGADWNLELSLFDLDSGDALDITGYSASFTIYDLPVDGDLLYDVGQSGSGGSITVDVGASKVTISLSTSDTTALDFSSGYYHLDITDGTGETVRALRGTLQVDG